VCVAPARPLLSVAHQVGTTAVLSGDRVVLGVGVGWMREEYEAYGQPFETRGKRLDEMIPALRALWQPDWVEFDGAYYHVAPMRLTPSPAKPVPIYAGGDSEAARRRAAELCEGWILAGPLPLDAVAERVTDMRRRLDAVGRSSAEFTIVAMAPEPWNVDAHRRLADLGVDDVVCVPWTDFASSAASKRDDIARFGDEVIATVNA